jgi:hypothetical protein
MSGTTMTTTPPTSNDPAVQLAIADLAERLGIATADVEVVSVDEVTWRDGSLGCPQPGMNYTQALVDGRRIVLNVDGVAYAYHSGRSGEPFYCPAGRARSPIVDPRL